MCPGAGRCPSATARARTWHSTPGHIMNLLRPSRPTEQFLGDGVHDRLGGQAKPLGTDILNTHFEAEAVDPAGDPGGDPGTPAGPKNLQRGGLAARDTSRRDSPGVA
jgi:hypothetical protein